MAWSDSFEGMHLLLRFFAIALFVTLVVTAWSGRSPHVIFNGEVVLDNEQMTCARPGVALRGLACAVSVQLGEELAHQAQL